MAQLVDRAEVAVAVIDQFTYASQSPFTDPGELADRLDVAYARDEFRVPSVVTSYSPAADAAVRVSVMR